MNESRFKNLKNSINSENDLKSIIEKDLLKSDYAYQLGKEGVKMVNEVLFGLTTLGYNASFDLDTLKIFATTDTNLEKISNDDLYKILEFGEKNSYFTKDHELEGLWKINMELQKITKNVFSKSRPE